MCLCGNLARLLIYCAYLWPLDGLFARQGSTHNFKSRWIVFIWFLSFIWPEKKNRIHSTLMTHNAHLMRKQSGSFLALCGMALITDQPRTFFLDLCSERAQKCVELSTVRANMYRAQALTRGAIKGAFYSVFACLYSNFLDTFMIPGRGTARLVTADIPERVPAWTWTNAKWPSCQLGMTGLIWLVTELSKWRQSGSCLSRVLPKSSKMGAISIEKQIRLPKFANTANFGTHGAATPWANEILRAGTSRKKSPACSACASAVRFTSVPKKTGKQNKSELPAPRALSFN